MSVDTYAITGTAFVSIQVPGGSSFALLGYTESGVDMDITESKEEIMTDLFGTKTPQDFQDMGMMARITIPLIAYDSGVLAQVMNRGDRTTWGSLNTPGIALAQSGYGFATYITAPLAAAIPATGTTPGFAAAAPWYFYKCLLRTEAQRLATKANPFRLELVAWPWKSYTETTGKNAPLFTRSIV